jgi:hypothetical protein
MGLLVNHGSVLGLRPGFQIIGTYMIYRRRNQYAPISIKMVAKNEWSRLD